MSRNFQLIVPVIENKIKNPSKKNQTIFSACPFFSSPNAWVHINYIENKIKIEAVKHLVKSIKMAVQICLTLVLFFTSPMNECISKQKQNNEKRRHFTQLYLECDSLEEMMIVTEVKKEIV